MSSRFFVVHLGGRRTFGQPADGQCAALIHQFHHLVDERPPGKWRSRLNAPSKGWQLLCDLQHALFGLRLGQPAGLCKLFLGPVK